MVSGVLLSARGSLLTPIRPGSAFARPPFNGSDESEVFSNIVDSEPSFDAPEWKTVSPAGLEFVQMMLRKEPASRPSAARMLQHRWIQDSGRTVPRKRTISTSSMRRLQEMQKQDSQKRLQSAKSRIRMARASPGNPGTGTGGAGSGQLESTTVRLTVAEQLPRETELVATSTSEGGSRRTNSAAHSAQL